MKRTFSVIFALMIVAGAALAITGYASGASTTIFLVDNEYASRPSAFVEPKSFTLTDAPEGMTGLRLDIAIGDIRIRPGDAFRVEADFRMGAKPEYRFEDGILTVFDSGRNITDISYTNFGFNTKLWQNTVEITLPERALNTLSVVLNLGDLTVDGLDIAAADLTLNLGDLRMRDVTLDRLTVVNNLGGVNISGTLNGNTDIVANLGEVSVTTTSPESAYKADMTLSLGNLYLNGNKLENGFLGVSYHKAGGEIPLSIRADLGNVTIRFGK